MASKKNRRAPEPEVRKFRKKASILNSEGIKYVDYKDVNLLRKFMSERAKIRQRRVTGNSQKQQREVARAIRIAREMALLPYNVRQVTSKSKKRKYSEDDEPTLEAAENELAKQAEKQKRRSSKEGARQTSSETKNVETKTPELVDAQSAATQEA